MPIIFTILLFQDYLSWKKCETDVFAWQLKDVRQMCFHVTYKTRSEHIYLINAIKKNVLRDKCAPTKQHSCNECNKSYRTRAGLYYYVKMFTNVFLNKCVISVVRNSITRQLLMVTYHHMWILNISIVLCVKRHTGITSVSTGTTVKQERLWKCDECGKMFKAQR